MNQNKDYKDYELIENIRNAKYGYLYKAKNKKTNEQRAIKIIEKSKIRNSFINIHLREPTEEEMKSYIDGYLKEIEYMKLMEGKNKDNNNIIKYYEYFENRDEFAIVMELCDDNLLNNIASRKEPYKPEEIFKILNQLNNSFKIMTENKLIHRNLNLKNILIKNENEKYILKLKLNHYGCFLKNLSSSHKSAKHGNLNFIPPEILKGEEYNEKSDLWSLGVIIYVLSFKSNPYKYNNKKGILNDIKNNGQKQLEKTNDSELNDLMSKLMIEDPSKRISWKEYFNHPFFIKKGKNDNKDNKDNKDNSFLKNSRTKEDYKNYYEILKKIGGGGFGNIYEAKDKNTNEKKALKIIDKDRMKSKLMILKNNINVSEYLNEITCMKNLEGKNQDNKNTVKFYEYFDNEKEFVIVMELCDENLVKHIANRGPFNEKEIYELLTQLNNSFKNMKEKKITHRDLKPQNILIKNENKKKIYKLSDYGLSKQLIHLNQELTTMVGTALFKAPEIMEGKKFNYKCDLWSLGVIIYLLLFKKYPYNGRSETIILEDIKKKGQKELFKSKDNELDDLIRKLLVKDPEKRISWEEYFEHPFFKKFK